MAEVGGSGEWRERSSQRKNEAHGEQTTSQIGRRWEQRARPIMKLSTAETRGRYIFTCTHDQINIHTATYENTDTRTRTRTRYLPARWRGSRSAHSRKSRPCRTDRRRYRPRRPATSRPRPCRRGRRACPTARRLVRREMRKRQVNEWRAAQNNTMRAIDRPRIFTHPSFFHKTVRDSTDGRPDCFVGENE